MRATARKPPSPDARFDLLPVLPRPFRHEVAGVTAVPDEAAR